MSRGHLRGILVVMPVLLASHAAADSAGGVAWRSLTLPEALAAAGAEGKLVLVDVWAGWSDPCRARDERVWGTTEGAALAAGTVPIRVDFDTDEGQVFKRERNILGLPSVLVLRADGSEVDRVDGFTEREAFLAELRSLLRGTDPLPALLRDLRENPRDPERALAVARRQLQRGEVEEGLALLHDVQDRYRGRPAAAEALSLEGRYLHRVREDPAAALEVWLKLVRGHRDSPLRPDGMSWALRAYVEDGRVEDGWVWIRRTAAKDGHDGWAAYLAARYALEHDRNRDTAWALLSRARADAVAALSEEAVATVEASLAGAPADADGP